jgi:hypothetical protein
MSKKKNSSIDKAAKGIAEDVSDSKSARMDSLRKLGKSSKEKSKRSLGNTHNNDKIVSQIISEFTSKMTVKNNDMYYTVKEFEQDVYRIEGFKVIVRASTMTKIKKYTYKKRCASNNTVKYFLEKRLKGITDSEFEFVLPYINCAETLGDLRALEAIDIAATSLSTIEEE